MWLPEIRVNMRWMIRRDMPEVMAIENASFSDPWTEEDFANVLRQRNAIGMVAEVASGKYELSVVGQLLYEVHKNRFHLLNIAVDPAFRCRGVGRQMIAKMVNKLSLQRRSKLQIEVSEYNLGGQLFLRSVGFKATSIIHEFIESTKEDAYTMELRCREKQEAAS